MNATSIAKEDIFYSITSQSLSLLISQMRNKKGYVEKLKNFSQQMATRRSWSQLISEYKRMILSARNTQTLSSSLVKKHEPRSITKGYSYA
jgi:hypothetical protein